MRINGDVQCLMLQSLAAEWPQSDRRVAAEWPQSDRRVAAEWPQGDRRVAAEWPHRLYRDETVTA